MLGQVIIALACAAAITSSTAAAAAPGDGLAKPMRLGIEATGEAQRPRVDPRQARRKDCKAWQRTADRLGETFAGSRLRRSVVARACALENLEPADSVWSWPWQDKGVDGDLPPRLAEEIGPWSIRCGAAGRRERCAMIHEGRLAAPGAAPDPAAQTVRFVTHFVIDAVAGQERLVWRLFIDSRSEDRSAAGRVAPQAGFVEVTGGNGPVRERFDACGRAGCLMEAEFKVSTEIATELWEGRAVPVTAAVPGAGTLLSGELPHEGLRRALVALSRLKARENNMLAVHQTSPQ